MKTLPSLDKEDGVALRATPSDQAERKPIQHHDGAPLASTQTQ